MRSGWFVKTQSVIFAFIVHVAVLLLLLISFSYTPELRTVKTVDIVNAVAVDKARVDEELKRLKQEDEKKNQAEKQHVVEQEKKLEDVKKKTDDAERKLHDIQKKNEDAQQKQEEVQKKSAELEQQRKLEEEKKANTEAEKKRLDEEKKKKEAELRKKEEEKKQQEAKQALQEQLEAEQAGEQRQQDASLIEKIKSDIYNKIRSNFNLTGLPKNLTCTLHVKLLPGGEVIDVAVIKSSGNEIFDSRAIIAVKKATPLPVPEDVETFERLDLRDNTFPFTP